MDGYQVKGGGELGKKMKGSVSTNWQLQNSYGDGKYSIGNIVNNVVITMNDVSGTRLMGGITS